MTLPVITERLGRLISWRTSPNGAGLPPKDEPPFRGELFSVDQLERHAKVLAASHQLASGRAADKLIPRLDENERILIHTYDLVTAAVKRNRPVAPAAEWLLDNFYLIEEQVRTARRHFPQSYSRQLPRLANGPAASYPRVYGIALDLISHVDGRVDAISLNGFIASYQTVTPLKLGELWAIPIMLRLALIENLRRVAARVAAGRQDRDLAVDWAERMVRVVEQNPSNLILVMADMARANPPLSGPFLAEMTRHLHGQSPYFAFATSWLETRVAEQGFTTEQLVQADGQAQAADQVSIGNSINSLRFLSSNDWREFVENHSLLEQVLRGDPAGVYAAMDFATRDRYRHEVEELAKRSPLSENDVAHKAIQLAQAAAAPSVVARSPDRATAGSAGWSVQETTPQQGGLVDGKPGARTVHVGYYLVDEGRAALERSARVSLSWWILAAKIGRRYPLFFYLLVVLLVAAGVTAAFLDWSSERGVQVIPLCLLAIPSLMAAAHLGVGVANWLATLLVQPRPLPRLDFRDGIPPAHRTMVVVPTMLSNAESIQHLLDGLEVRYLANQDDNLHFALLTDLEDAPQEVMPSDEELVRLAREGVEQLNQKYARQRSDIFFLHHRPRRWNEQEGVWMGYERKRGKLAEFNALLRGAQGRFDQIIGAVTVLPQVRYVITLDTDTQLPRDAARELVGTMAHPLNRPVFDPRRRRVTAGYGILQPRVGVSLPSARRSWFVRLFAGDAGIDPYTRVVSDVYQDLFGEGSFIGKGIYDVEAFEQSCGAFPENAILSHDLLESTHARSALLSDVELYEDYPSRYPADVSRRHRWMRGDWQIAWWLLPWVPGPVTEWVRNPISVLSWWKIFDNLRRSLVPVGLMALLLISWLLAPPVGAAATLLVLAVVGMVPLLAVLADLVRKPADLPLWTHLGVTTHALGQQAAQLLFTLIVLPYEAYVSFDAIVRTLVRVLWTKKRLLEWKTSSEAERGSRIDLPGFFKTMWIGPGLAGAALVLLTLFQPELLSVAGGLLALWLISPVVAWWLSRPLAAPAVQLSGRQRIFLEKLSRRTWRFFEVFVTAEENWLPPDNVQEQAAQAIASRTSPTNIGMAILADLAACDFAYCSVGRLLDRTQKTFGTLARMERHRGHFYNWYDTRSLKPLTPLYVSTVDSGNLAGDLLVLRGGLLELIEAPVLPSRLLGGLRDTARILLDVARGLHRIEGAGPLVSPEVLGKIERLEGELEKQPLTLRGAVTSLERLTVAAVEITAAAGTDEELQWWASAFERSCRDHRDDLFTLAAWIKLPPLPETVSPIPPPSPGEMGSGKQSAEQLQRQTSVHELLVRLETVPSLRDVAGLQQAVLPMIDAILEDLGRRTDGVSTDFAGATEWFGQLRRAILSSGQHAAERIKTLEQIAQQCQEWAEMDFSFLLDKTRDLFAIGYQVGYQRLDASFYDLLASEARLASFVAIAQGQLGQEHWFALGRLLTTTGGASTLLSWSGSMFEYLMPLLVMPTYENTLLDQTYRAAVRRQIHYGRQRGVPWGISESGYNTIDVHMNYQYRAFGVPGLGLKRGLAEDLVIAPYATALAVMVAPDAACRNLERLVADGRAGAYGMYEAIDYTPSRVPRGAKSVTVRQFMAHHQGMSLLALAYVLLDKPMQRRFEANPMLRAADLLLQERVPRTAAPVFPHVAEAGATRTASAEEKGTLRIYTDPNGSVPEVHLLSNGRYHVMITSAGGGYSRWRDLAVTRWREDATRDCWGSFCYLRDLESGTFWSTAWQPTLTGTKRYEAIFTQGRAEFRRRDERINTHTEIGVSPEDDIELRRITLTNRSDKTRIIDVTSYAEVVLAPQDHDLAHPAFSNLFVQTELVRNRQAIICTRRPRSAEERPPWLVHLMTVRGTTVGEASFETDRMRFIGRRRTLTSPAAMDPGTRLSDSQGPVLDPVVCIRHVIRLEPNETVKVDLVTGVAESREAVTALMEKYYDPRLADRVFELAWTHSHILLQQLNATETDAQAYGRLAGSIIFASAQRRAKASVLTRNRRGQSGLWGYGISGDLPIVLVRSRDRTRIELVRQAVHAHAYWRMRGLSVDLVIWNEDDSVYRQTLQDMIMDLVASSPEAALVDKPGGIFVRRGEQMSEEDRSLLQTVARVVLADDAGTLLEQVERRGRADVLIPALKPARNRAGPRAAAELSQRDLMFFNGLGGFTRDGREYVITLGARQTTPAPWVNVIANPQFGTVVSESGSVYTWSENSHEFRLTPWYNDPVAETSGEAIYIRDEENGRFWSPTPLPARGRNPYVTRHGFGYSIFEHEEDGIVTELCLFVATDAPVKFARLKFTNRSGRSRQLSVTGYWEWVLGELRHKTLMHVITEVDPISGALFTRNTYNPEFADRVVFLHSSEGVRTVTADRTEFLGRNGTPANPAALGRVRLSGRVGAGLDPCAAMQVPVALEDGQDREIVFILGAARGEEQARQLVHRFRGTASARQALEGVWHYWSRSLGVVYVETPDPEVNFLANGWLIYQVLACRMWARTGFYQSGGAFGFRDQLQDAMAVVHAEPGLLREHLLRAAAHQFREGDVQHWWHPPAGRGVRTHFSDDYLWLPFATCRYVAATGDTGVLDERVPFLNARAVRPEEDAYYDLPQVSDDVGTLYEHCVRALDHGLRFGSHGLPLMGSGDWNDGMNLVGAQGKGESVWLAFFLGDALTQFAELAGRRGAAAVAEKFTSEAARLRENIEKHTWDGEWYLRAYFDDGTPLGSTVNQECRIDALSQSWSVLSGIGEHERSVTAMASVDRLLVRRDARQIQLLNPPFDKSPLNPGYIKGYVPGVRENGGQYTHAAVWTVMAFAALGDSRRAWELFRLINPVTHATTPESAALYRVEPYVVAADVYAVPPHTGRGGWTWYTGAAGWMYRLITESLLGLRLDVDKLRFAPCLPPAWSSLKIHYRYRETFYHITLNNGGNGFTVKHVIVDGIEQAEPFVSLIDDRNHHNVEVEVG
ncbi:cyclic beta 1-2 glucan synthetase [Planctomycetaceae bacterium SCGC AG-212-F19]|nr:cyclic beta 1-2 glucan synthetase [Planctomycetaceae bacterium SCGC AG-212-F19]